MSTTTPRETSSVQQLWQHVFLRLPPPPPPLPDMVGAGGGAGESAAASAWLVGVGQRFDAKGEEGGELV